MGIVNNVLAGASGQATGYNLTRSLRFRSSASAYLNRTPASAGNQQRWTFSTWVKRGALGATQVLFGQGTGTGANGYGFFRFDSTDILQISCSPNGATSSIVWSSTPVYRDPSAWYHVVAVLDTTQATAANRFVLYVNGVAQSGSFSTTPTQNANIEINRAAAHQIGCANAVSLNNFLDGYQTEINFIDGQALTPSSFGETSSTTGVWQPKKYSGTYGTNGFYLPFTDNSALTSGSNAGLGKDFSGNGNYWNTNNISITSGSTYDSMTDVPTLTSATASNFATLNPLTQGQFASSYASTPASATGATLTQGNLYATGANAGTGAYGAWVGTIPLTGGQFYWETTLIAEPSADFSFTGVVRVDAGTTSAPYVANNGSYTVNDVLGFTWDDTAKELKWYKNGTLQTTLVTGATGTYAPFVGLANANVMAFNFGQRPFAYTPPTGYVALNTYNLPTPTIGATASSQGNKYFDVLTWTGTGNTGRTFTGLNFAPDFVWAKVRSAAYSHSLYDTIRGAGPNAELETDTAGAEGSGNNDVFDYLSAFNSDGFTSTWSGSNRAAYFNESGKTYVAWNWKANGTGVTNTAGSITSTVSANTTSGFSVVTYTGTGSAATVGHGLGVAPKMIITKTRNQANDWYVYHASMGNTKNIYLNSTAASSTSNLWWNATSPTSTVFSVGDQTGNNGSGVTIVAYCFAEIAGFSKFGSYTGNGSSDGPFIYTGFRPRYIMTKVASSPSTDDWLLADTARFPYNVVNMSLAANLSNAESYFSGNNIDILSSGFKIRNSGNPNTNGATYIYMAFAENPFKYSLAR